MSVVEANKSLTRTINVGLHLNGTGDDGWCIHPDQETWQRIKQAGFTAVRLCIQWAAHCNVQAPFTIEPTTFSVVDEAVAGATRQGLAVLISNFLDPELMHDPVGKRERFLAISRQVAEHYASTPSTILFELLAEPREKMDVLWNDYLAAGLAEMRVSNPSRAIVVGPASYNNARKLPQLLLPEGDRNLIVTLHHYWPLKFTIQGESFFYEEWSKMPFLMKLFLGNPRRWPGTVWTGKPRERAIIRNMFDKAAAWAKEHDRPIFVGEFGSSSTADMASRVRWAQFVRTLCEERGMSWGYWSYGPAFALYDLDANRWQEELLQVLIPIDPKGQH